MPALRRLPLRPPAIHKGVKSLTLNVPLWEFHLGRKVYVFGKPLETRPKPLPLIILTFDLGNYIVKNITALEHLVFIIPIDKDDLPELASLQENFAVFWK